MHWIYLCYVHDVYDWALADCVEDVETYITGLAFCALEVVDQEGGDAQDKQVECKEEEAEFYELAVEGSAGACVE